MRVEDAEENLWRMARKMIKPKINGSTHATRNHKCDMCAKTKMAMPCSQTFNRKSNKTGVNWLYNWMKRRGGPKTRWIDMTV